MYTILGKTHTIIIQSTCNVVPITIFFALNKIFIENERFVLHCLEYVPL